jgi:hypothetical protein
MSPKTDPPSTSLAEELVRPEDDGATLAAAQMAQGAGKAARPSRGESCRAGGGARGGSQGAICKYLDRLGEATVLHRTSEARWMRAQSSRNTSV